MWLEEQRRATAAEIDRLAKELNAILLAQKIKNALQQKNLVALQQILRDNHGNASDIIIRILNLPDALALLDDQRDTLDQLNAAAQLHGWREDGYDVETSKQLRR